MNPKQGLLALLGDGCSDKLFFSPGGPSCQSIAMHERLNAMKTLTEGNVHSRSLPEAGTVSRRDLLGVAALSGLGLFTPALLAGCGGASASGLNYTAALQEAQTAACEVLGQGSATALGVALVIPERTVWAQSYGLVDLTTRQAPTASTMFAIASASKIFATVAIMQLVEQGLLKLDEPVLHYLPSFRMADPRFTAITVRMLLNHSSGFPGATYRNNYTSKPASGHAEMTFATLAAERLKAAPGYMNVYCNDGFTMLELLVKAVTAMSYADYVRSAILDPLGLKNTSFTLTPFADASFARFHIDGVAQPEEFVGSQASGGLYTTPTDL
ncbi:MAG: serine hydrolase domain-containing protein, partial [Rhodoferax sp.]